MPGAIAVFSHPPLLEPIIAVAGKQVETGNDFDQVIAKRLAHVIAVVGLQYVLDAVRVTDEIVVGESKPGVDVLAAFMATAARR